MSKNSSFIKELDYLSFNPSIFSFKDSKVYKNTFGGVISILTFFLIILSVSYFVIDFLSRKNFSANTSLFHDTNSFFDLKELPMFFSLVNIYNPISESEKFKYWDMTLTLWNTTNGKSSFEIIPLEKCNLNNYPQIKEYRKLFLNKALDFSQFLCPNFKDFQGSTILNDPYGESNSTFLHLYIHYCYEIDESPVGKGGCVGKEEMKNALEYTYFHFQTIDFTIDNQDESEPMKPYILERTVPMVSSMNKRIWITIRNALYSSDVGWLIEGIQKIDLFQFSNYEIEYNFSRLSSHWLPNHFGSMTISFTQTKEIIERRYLKIQEMMANVGGILKMIYLFSSFISHIVSENIFYKETINSKYLSIKDFQQKIESRLDSKSLFNLILQKPKKNNFIVEKIQENFNNSINSIKMDSHSNLKEIKIIPSINSRLNLINKEFPCISSKAEIIKFNVCDYLIPLFCWKTKNKNKYFLTQRDSIIKELNIENLLNVYTELKNIKSIFFDDLQISVLSNINYSREKKEEDKIEKKERLLEGLSLIQSRENLSNGLLKEVDSKILNQILSFSRIKKI